MAPKNHTSIALLKQLPNHPDTRTMAESNHQTASTPMHRPYAHGNGSEFNSRKLRRIRSFTCLVLICGVEPQRPSFNPRRFIR